MLSKGMHRTWSTGSDSLKVRAVITGSLATAGAIYYWRPKTKCKLLGAELTLLTNTGGGTEISISRCCIADTEPLVRDKIQISTGITDTEIASSDMWKYTLPNTALTTTEFQPQATISDLFLTIDPDAKTTDLESYGNAVRIHLADLGSGAQEMTGILTLEYIYTI